jgi:hypothetical protein
MLRAAKGSFILLGVVALAGWAHGPAEAGCQVISATHSADTKGEALKSSQALAAESANELRSAKGWKYVSMRARRVKPDPFWKAVRPVVPKDVILKPDVVTARTYTTCFTGVVVPYVCTSGSVVCATDALSIFCHARQRARPLAGPMTGSSGHPVTVDASGSPHQRIP